MGNPKQKWTAEEEEALRAGIAKHGTGKWKNIQRDPEFNHLLSSRSNIDLKDKWRNLSVSNNLGPRDKSRAPKPKPVSEAPVVPSSNPQTSAPAVTVTHDAPADSVMSDSSKSVADGKLAPWYNGMIFEAFSTLKEPEGLDTSTILNFIEQRDEGPAPTNFRRYLTARLRRLAQQDKLEKVQNGMYKLKGEEPLSGTKTPLPKQRDIRPSQAPVTTTFNQYPGETEKDAAMNAARKIAEAENKAHVASEAVKEAERILKISEDEDAKLMFFIEIYERCSRGESVQLA